MQRKKDRKRKKEREKYLIFDSKMILQKENLKLIIFEDKI